MDGKTGAEELIAKVLADPALLNTLTAKSASPIHPEATPAV
jgi:predicted component of type VI protein secretion system